MINIQDQIYLDLFTANLRKDIQIKKEEKKQNFGLLNFKYITGFKLIIMIKITWIYLLGI